MPAAPMCPRCLPLLLLVLAALLVPVAASAAAFHSPHDVIDAWAISPDFARDRTLFVSLTRFNLVLRSRDAGQSFEVVNVGLDTAYVLGLAISPDFARDRTVFCSEVGHVFVSRDAGEHWEQLPLPPHLRAVRALAVSPDYATDGMLAVGTGRDGLWLSRDRGATWTRAVLPADAADTARAAAHAAAARGAVAPEPAPATVESLVFSPTFARDRRIWALLDGTRVLGSADGGATFTALATPAGGGLQALAVDVPGHVLWVGTRAHGVLRSADGGFTWKPDGTETAGMDVLHLALARDADDAPVLFASTADDGVLFKTGSKPWSTNAEGFREQTDQTLQHYHGTLPSPDFARDHVVYAATFEGLYVSHEGGDGWQWLDVLHPRLVRNLTHSPDFADDGTFWLSTYGLGLLEARPSAGADVERPGEPVPARTILGEEGGLRFRRLDTSGWWFPDGIAISPAVREDHTLMVGAPNRLLFSNDGGATSRAAIDTRKGFARALAFAPDYAETGVAFAYLSTYTGTGPSTNRFTRSPDRGATWVDTNVSAVEDMAFATDWASSGRMHVACPDGLWTSEDRGLTFRRNEALDAKGCVSVAVAAGAAPAAGSAGIAPPGGASASQEDTSDDGAAGVPPDILLVCSAFSGLSLSRDGGATWEHLGNGLDGARFDFVELSPDFARDGLAFAGPRTQGVFVTRDGGANWAVSPGGPRVVLCMERSPTFARDRTLLVGSYDGAWISRDAAASWTRLEIPLGPNFKQVFSK